MAVPRKENKTTVQGTNDNSIVSKYSMTDSGYFCDPFTKYFVSKKQRRAPLINRGYFVRAKAIIDTVLRGFLDVSISTSTTSSSTSCAKSQRKQIISFGAGFDSTYFRLHSQGLLQNTNYIEVDFKGVIERKTQIIRANEILLKLTGKITETEHGFGTEKYRLVDCDLRNIAKLESLFSSSGIDYKIPTLLLSEVVMTYMDPESSSQLLQWTAAKFDAGIFLTYEQIHPDDAFGLVMQKHFNSLQSPLLCINTYPTMGSQSGRYLSSGWSEVEIMDMNHFYFNYVSEKERHKIDGIEPFDEFEEWHLKCSHYSMTVASNGSCSEEVKRLLPTKQPNEKEDRIIQRSNFVWRRLKTNCSFIERFGHSTCRITNNCLLICGGFGSMDSKHGRLKNGIIVNFGNQGSNNEMKLQQTDLLPEPRLFHTSTPISNGRIFVFGGRSSPVKPSKISLLITVSDNATSKINEEKNTPYVYEDNGHSFDMHVCNLPRSTELDEPPKEIIKAIGAQGYHEVPCPRWRHAAQRIKDNDGTEKVLIFGGRTENDLGLSDCWTFDTQTLVWKRESLQGKEPIARHSHTICEWKDKLILVGGLDKNSNPLSLIEILDPMVSPMLLEAMQLKRPLPPRYSHSAHVVNDRLILLGGVNPTDHYSPDLVIIDLNNKDWENISLPAQDPLCPIMLHNHTSEMIDSKTLMVIGGGGNCFSFGTHLNKHLLSIDLSSLLYHDI